MNEKISLHMLTSDSVSISKQNVTIINGVEYTIGNMWMKAYANSIRGREEMIAEVPEPYKSVILLMWGGSPTITE